MTSSGKGLAEPADTEVSRRPIVQAPFDAIGDRLTDKTIGNGPLGTGASLHGVPREMNFTDGGGELGGGHGKQGGAHVAIRADEVN